MNEGNERDVPICMDRDWIWSTKILKRRCDLSSYRDHCPFVFVFINYPSNCSLPKAMPLPLLVSAIQHNTHFSFLYFFGTKLLCVVIKISFTILAILCIFKFGNNIFLFCILSWWSLNQSLEIDENVNLFCY